MSEASFGVVGAGPLGPSVRAPPQAAAPPQKRPPPLEAAPVNSTC